MGAGKEEGGIIGGQEGTLRIWVGRNIQARGDDQSGSSREPLGRVEQEDISGEEGVWRRRTGVTVEDGAVSDSILGRQDRFRIAYGVNIHYLRQ